MYLYHPTWSTEEQLVVLVRLWSLFRALVVPARQAYSHCASVGRANRYPAGRRPAARSRSVSAAQNASASSRLTKYTGMSSSLPCLLPSKASGMAPITVSYCFCVTSYLPSQKSRVRVTACCVSSACRPSSPVGLPIVNVPEPIQTISISELADNGTVTLRLRASARRNPH